MNNRNSRSTVRQETAIQRGARLILVSTSLSLLCACGGGAAVSESQVDILGTVLSTIQQAPPPKVVVVDVLTLQYSLDDPNPATRRDKVERLGFPVTKLQKVSVARSSVYHQLTPHGGSKPQQRGLTQVLR